MAKNEDTAPDSSKVWSIFSLAAALLGATVARKTVTKSWQAATGKNPPANPADPDVDMWEAVLWAAASGMAIQITRMLFARRAADYYARSTGHLPPGLGHDDQDSTKAGSATT